MNDNLSPWPQLENEKTELFKVAENWRTQHPFSRYSVLLEDCAVTATYWLGLSVPIKRFGLLSGNADLPLPSVSADALSGSALIGGSSWGGHQQFIELMALAEKSDALDGYLKELSYALSRARAWDEFEIARFASCSIDIALADPQAEEGSRTIWAPRKTKQLKQVIEQLRVTPTAGRTALVDRDGLSDESGPASLLGIRCWKEGDHVTIDDNDTEGQRFHNAETDEAEQNLTYRVVLKRRPLADALERMMHASLDVDEKIAKVFKQHAPAGTLS